MSLPLKVLGDRVLVRPDVNANAPEQVGSVYVATSLAAAVTGEDPSRSLCRGTVVAVGRPRHPKRHEAEALATDLAWIHDEALIIEEKGYDIVKQAKDLLKDLVRREPCVAVGDDVLYSHDAGQQLTIKDETLIILHEHELLGIVTPEPVGAV